MLLKGGGGGGVCSPLNPSPGSASGYSLLFSPEITVESRFFEPPGETQIGSRNREFEKSKVSQINLNWPVIV